MADSRLAGVRAKIARAQEHLGDVQAKIRSVLDTKEKHPVPGSEYDPDSQQLIILNRELLVGSVVIVRNKRGTQVSARVVTQVSALEGVHTCGIEFVEQDDRARDFWGITFPSND